MTGEQKKQHLKGITHTIEDRTTRGLTRDLNSRPRNGKQGTLPLLVRKRRLALEDDDGVVLEIGHVESDARRDGQGVQDDGRARGLGLAGRRVARGAAERAGGRALLDGALDLHGARGRRRHRVRQDGGGEGERQGQGGGGGLHHGGYCCCGGGGGGGWYNILVIKHEGRCNRMSDTASNSTCRAKTGSVEPRRPSPSLYSEPPHCHAQRCLMYPRSQNLIGTNSTGNIPTC